MIIYHTNCDLPRGFLCKKYLYAFLTILYLPIHSVDVYQNCRIWFDPVLGSRQGPASTAHWDECRRFFYIFIYFYFTPHTLGARHNGLNTPAPYFVIYL